MRYPSNITKSYLFRLSIPIFFSNLAVPLVGIVDTGLMGHLNNSKFLVATSISTSVMTLILWSFGFLRMGTVGLVSQSLGKGDYREIVNIVVRNLVIAIIASVIIILLKNPLLELIKFYFITSIETQDYISKYITIRVFSSPAELSIYVLVGFYLGIQKTKISSLIVSIFCLLNIIISTILVIKFNLQIRGVAYGTLASSFITVIIFYIYTYSYLINKFKVIPKLKNIFTKKKLTKILSINFDIFIRTILLTFAFLWVTYQGAKIGEEFVAVNSILMQFIIFSSFLLDAYAFSTESVVGYTVGRGVQKSFLNTSKNSFELSFFTSIILSLFYILFAKYIINFLTDLDVIRFMSYSFIFWIILIPPVASFCYQLDGIYIGAAQTTDLRNAMIISVALYIASSFFLIDKFNNHGLWLSLLLLMIFRSLTLAIFFSRILKKF